MFIKFIKGVTGSRYLFFTYATYGVNFRWIFNFVRQNSRYENHLAIIFVLLVVCMCLGNRQCHNDWQIDRKVYHWWMASNHSRSFDWIRGKRSNCWLILISNNPILGLVRLRTLQWRLLVWLDWVVTLFRTMHYQLQFHHWHLDSYQEMLFQIHFRM